MPIFISNITDSRTDDIYVQENSQTSKSYKSKALPTAEERLKYDELIRSKIEKYKFYLDFNEQELVSIIDTVLFEDYNPASNVITPMWTFTGIWFENKYVASAVNVALSLTIEGTTSVGIKASIVQLVKGRVQKEMFKSITETLFSAGIRKYPELKVLLNQSLIIYYTQVQ